jgi:putative transposase
MKSAGRRRGGTVALSWFGVTGTTRREFIVRQRHTAFRITFALSRAKAGSPIADVCDVVGISIATFRQWKRKYDGLRPAEVYRLRRLENENRKLKMQLAKLLGTGWRQRDATIGGARR